MIRQRKILLAALCIPLHIQHQPQRFISDLFAYDPTMGPQMSPQAAIFNAGHTVHTYMDTHTYEAYGVFQARHAFAFIHFIVGDKRDVMNNDRFLFIRFSQSLFKRGSIFVPFGS